MIRAAVRSWSMLAILAVAPSPAAAQPPGLLTPEEATAALLRVAPAGSAACLCVEDLAGHARALESGGVWDRLRGTPAGAKVAGSPDWQRLRGFEAILPFYLGISVAELRDQVIGRSLVLAYQPGAVPGKDDVGLLLCHADNPAALEKLFRRLAEPGGGAPLELRHRGQTYWRRRSLGKEEPLFLLRMGPIGALCDKESAIQAVIDASGSQSGLLGDPAVRAAAAAAPTGRLLRLLVRPRAFDPWFRAWAAHAGTPGDVWAVEQAAAAWKRLAWAAASAGGQERSLQFGLHLGIDGLVARTAPPSSPLPRPNGALASLRIGFDIPPLAEWLAEASRHSDNQDDLTMMAELFRQLLPDYDFQTEVLPLLGGELRAAAWPGKPLHAAAALPLASARRPGRPSAAENLDNALRSLAVLAAVDHGRQQKAAAAVRTEVRDGVRLHWWEGIKDQPAWLRPCFAIVEGQLLVATSPEAALEWLRPAAPAPTAPAWRGKLPAGSQPVGWLATRSAGDWLQTQVPQWFPDAKPADVARLAGFLGLAEGVAFATQQADGAWHLHVVVVGLP